ncbi:MAG: hypothetical protein JSR98_02620 [Proteobacteria bacterium]|nr:hypothetical protein [Pseudomonadota bacterium]
MADATDKDAEYYGYFMTGLMGLMDDAQLASYDAEGIRHLRAARQLFSAEFQRRHPDAWRLPDSEGDGTS